MRAGDTPAAQAACVEAAEVANAGRGGAQAMCAACGTLVGLRAAFGYGQSRRRRALSTGVSLRCSMKRSPQDGADGGWRVRLLGRLAMELTTGTIGSDARR
jgi:hypothetical protein